jgi:hypothetical protein
LEICESTAYFAAVMKAQVAKSKHT